MWQTGMESEAKAESLTDGSGVVVEKGPDHVPAWDSRGKQPFPEPLMADPCLLG